MVVMLLYLAPAGLPLTRKGLITIEGFLGCAELSLDFGQCNETVPRHPSVRMHK